MKNREIQPERDEITRGLVRDVQHYDTQLEEVDKAISDFLPRFECTLNSISGVNDITVAKLLSEIGDIRRFPNADKLADFAGIAPVKFCLSGKGDDKPSKQGNRRRLCLLSKAVGKRQEQNTGIDSDIQTAS